MKNNTKKTANRFTTMHDSFEENLFDRFVLFFLHMNHKQEDRLYTSYNTKKGTKNVYDIKYMACITMITVSPIQMIYSCFNNITMELMIIFLLS